MKHFFLQEPRSIRFHQIVAGYIWMPCLNCSARFWENYSVNGSMACQICWYSQRNYRLCSLDWSLGFSLSEILIVNELTRSVLFLYVTPSICSRKTFYFIMRAFVLCIFNWNLNFTAMFEFNCNSFMGVIIC